MQQALTRVVENVIEEKLETNVSIGTIEVELFNKVTIKNLRIEDKNRKELLNARLASAKIELSPLLEGRISLRTVSLLDANVLLYKGAKNSPANFQFIVDAFASKEKKEKKPLDLRINSIILRRVNVKWDELYMPATPRRFDVHHLAVNDIDANISLKELTDNNLNLRIRTLSFNEQSGIFVKHLSMRVKANRKEAEVQDFRLELARSVIAQKQLRLAYDVRDGLSNFVSSFKCDGHFSDAVIDFRDLRPFVRLPQNYAPAFRLNATFKATPKHLALSDLSLKALDNRYSLSTQVSLTFSEKTLEAVSAKRLLLHADAETMATVAPVISSKPNVQRMLTRLGSVNLSGNAVYRAKGRGKADFTLHTAQGNVESKAFFKDKTLEAKVMLNGFKPAALWDSDALPERVTASVEGKLKFPVSITGGEIKATADLKEIVWRGYRYQNIRLDAEKMARSFTALLKSNDPNANLQLAASALLTNDLPTDLKLTAQVNRFAPHILALGKKWESAVLAGNIEADVRQLSLSEPRGVVRISDMKVEGGKKGDFKLDKFLLDATQHGDGSRVVIASDFLDATFEGDLEPRRLATSLKNLAARALPGLVEPLPEVKGKGDLAFKLKLRNTDAFTNLFGLKLRLDGPFTLQGVVRPDEQRSSFTAHTSGFELSNRHFTNIRFYLGGKGERFNSLMQFHHTVGKTDLGLALTLATDSGALRTDLQWLGDYKERYEGKLSTFTRFIKSQTQDGALVNFDTKILPTSFSIGDSLWQVASGGLRLQDKHFHIDDFKISHGTQMLALNGELSPADSDSIVAEFNEIDIAFIMNLLNFHPIEFGGLATGDAVVSLDGGSPKLKARLAVPDFKINESLMGRSIITGDYDGEEGKINLSALMVGDRGASRVSGFVSPKDKNLELNVSAHNLNLDFLTPYFNGIFEDFHGRAVSGSCQLYGPFKELDFQGLVNVEASALLPYTGVRYKLMGGNVLITPGSFDFRNFMLTNDKSSGYGTASGVLRHDHLKNIRYDFEAKVKNLLVYDRPKEVDMPFFATTYASGAVDLHGHPGTMTANIAVQPEAGTDFTYTVDAPGTFSDENMVKFGVRQASAASRAPNSSMNKDEEVESELMAETLVAEALADKNETTAPTTDIFLNFTLDMNPNATLRVVTDEKTGDNIALKGNGPLRATFYNKGAFQLFGTYNVEDGKYKMSIQDIIRKDLTIQPGSSVVFAGDPYNADLNLKAVYVVNSASLADLNYGAGFSKNAVRVDCILNISGKTGAPKVNFDLDLHNISEDEKQMVRNLIATDEGMNRQIIYLLGVGRFYTENYGETEAASTQSQSSVAMKSFLSSTLSGQLNDIISSAMGEAGANWTFGTNLSTGTTGWSDMEVDGLLQGRLFNNRLLINGNFGYRERSGFSSGQSNFVGDFDIRYLLTPGGNVSLKAYSETNDRYFTKSSLTTQGIGLLLQRDFSNLKDLFTVNRDEKRKKKRK